MADRLPVIPATFEEWWIGASEYDPDIRFIAGEQVHREAARIIWNLGFNRGVWEMEPTWVPSS